LAKFYDKVWLWIWTIASMRPFDIVVGLILLMLLIKGDWVFKAVQTRAALIGFVLTLILLLIIRTVFSQDHRPQLATARQRLDGDS
jgi:type VI protein secretion system component VasK